MSSTPEYPDKEPELSRVRDDERLFVLLQEELRRISHALMRDQRTDHTLNTTALVNEAFLRINERDRQLEDDQAHFLALAASAMRCILVDYARQRSAQKRIPPDRRIVLDAVVDDLEQRAPPLGELDEALDRLALIDARMAQLIELRFFGGCTMLECAAAVGMPLRSAERELGLARRWLKKDLE